MLGFDPQGARARCASASASCCRSAASTARSRARGARPLRRLLPAPARRSTRSSSSSASSDKRDERARRLSGGQRRRLDLALALIGDPELIFLDEPTTGFDPAARRTAWQTIRSLRELGKTVLLTTHYLDEAQELADRVAIIKGGQILAEGSPRELGVGGRVALPRRLRPRRRARDPPDRRSDALLHELTAAALARGERLEGLSVTRPSLEDVYLELTADA